MRIRIRSDPVILLGSGSGSSFKISLGPDPVLTPGSRIRIQDFEFLKAFKLTLAPSKCGISTTPPPSITSPPPFQLSLPWSSSDTGFFLDPDPVEKKNWIRIRFVTRGWIRIRIRFVTRGWIRIRIRSVSDRIRNPAPNLSSSSHTRSTRMLEYVYVFWSVAFNFHFFSL